MPIKDLISWNRGRSDLAVRRQDDATNPFLTLHREVSEGANEVKVTAELPGLEEKDVDIDLADNVLIIRGEKKTETEDKDRLFSERYYGRFERRIPVDDIDVDKVKASFKNGVLTVTLPRLPTAKSNIRRIAINKK